MFYAKHRSRRKKMKFVKGIAMLLCLVTIFTSVLVGNLGIGAEDGDRSETVKITVNYVYKSNNAMVAQPYTAQIEKGASFKKTLEVPKLFNYSIPNDEAIGLGTDSIVLTKDEATGKYSLAFDLQSVNENVEVTLYYVAGTAKYTVYHYYQNLENDEYGEPVVVELTGDIDAYTDAKAKNEKGFYCKGVPEYIVAADDTTTVKIFYDRIYYRVEFDVNSGVNGPDPIYAKFGTKFKVADVKTPNRDGYTFVGWAVAEGETVISGEVEITDNVTYSAQWLPNRGQADYTIVLWGQNANDDEYSYLGSYEAWGNVGNEVTWNEGTLISHVHDQSCEMICRHAHDETCYGGLKQETPYDAKTESDKENIEQFQSLFGTLKNGYIYRVKCDGAATTDSYDKYYLYFNDTWYLSSADACDGSAVKQSDKINAHNHSWNIISGNKKDQFWAYKAKLSCTHNHTGNCYSCGLIDTPKSYMSDIKPDNKLWKLVRSDTVTVDADGRTVLNVYFDRTVFTLTFNYRTVGDWDGRNGVAKTESITARWGANIRREYETIKSNSNDGSNDGIMWSESSSSGYSMTYTSHFEIMPDANATYYLYRSSGNIENKMTYLGADLKGEYKEVFTIVKFSARSYYSVTIEDFFVFDGFELNESASAKIGDDCNNIRFCYDRKTYELLFYSANYNDAEKVVFPKYQQPLGEYSDYIPVNRPTTVEPDAVFVGWYLNPECTGEEYDISAHTMPANNIALYAKWVNGLYTVRTYTDNTLETPYTYAGYSCAQENIEKYALATAPTDPKKDGYVFVGWFYKDGEAEKLFSFTMPITRDYDLYPKFDDQVSIKYTVHYYKDGTTVKVADDKVNTVKIGTTVTEKAKMGTELNLLSEVMQKKYYPAKTSTSEVIKAEGQEIIFYYTEAASVEYTVYYQDANGNNLKDPVTKNTEYSTVTEPYLPIDGYAPQQFSITKDMSAEPEQNKIVFIYYPTLTTLNIRKTGFDAADAGTTFIFRIKGTDENTKDIDLRVTIHGYVMGDHVPNVTVADLPVGSYTVTEESDWSWRYEPKNGEQTITLDPDGAKNVLTFENERKDGQWLSGDAYNNNLYKPDKPDSN